MKTLFLMRLGQAEKKSPEKTDQERALTEEGERFSRHITRRLIQIASEDVILVAPKVRSQQTSSIIQAHAEKAEILTCEELLSENNFKTMCDRIRSMEDRWEKALIIGSNPTLMKLSRKLIGKKSSPLRLPKSGIMAIESQAQTWEHLFKSFPHLKWTLSPDLELDNGIPEFSVVMAQQVDELIHQFIDWIPYLGRGKVKVVHDLRIICRRLLTFMGMYMPYITLDKSIQNRLYQFLAGTGRLRNAQVQMKLLESLTEDHHLITIFQDRLDQRKKQWKSDWKEMDDGKWEKALHRFVYQAYQFFYQPSPKNLSIRSQEVVLERIQSRLAKKVGRLEEHLPSNSVQWHAFRLRLKDLRYQIEWYAIASGEQLMHHTAQVLKDIQDHLGQLHDWDLMIKRLNNAQKKDSVEISQAIGIVEQERGKVLEWCASTILPKLQELDSSQEIGDSDRLS